MIISICVCGCSLNSKSSETISTKENIKDKKEAKQKNKSKTTNEAAINVFVCGEVIKPDVYSLPANSIAKDALVKAGGFTQRADILSVNLAKKLEDGEKLYFPSRDENKANSTADDITSWNTQESSSKDSNLVNINKATKEELMTLTGIGEKRALDIIDYRNTKAFKNVEDIKNVPGIKEGTFNKIKDQITV